MWRSRGFRTVVVGVETAASFPVMIDGGGAAVHDGVGYGQPWNERRGALAREEGGAFKEQEEGRKQWRF
jgi:hypothetical protein